MSGAVFTISSFYRFGRIGEDRLAALRERLAARAAELGLRGLVLLAREGLNGTVAGEAEGIASFKALLEAELGWRLDFKDSSAAWIPFKRLSVQVREEIVTFDMQLGSGTGGEGYLNPAEWDEALANGDAVVLDTRNVYETKLGMFKGAIDPGIKHFTDLPAFLDEAAIPTDRKILMYCTGGIRCEKASIEMRRRGYSQVFQLEGGILRYLEERPGSAFEGECFVFDQRVALDQKLRPSSRYRLCPHCGDPGDLTVSCGNCERITVVCESCHAHEHCRACSKNCSHHLRLRLGAGGRGSKKLNLPAI